MTLATHRFNPVPKPAPAKPQWGTRIGPVSDGVIYDASSEGPDTMVKEFAPRDTPNARQHKAIDELIRFCRHLNPEKTAEFALLDQLELPLRTMVGDDGTLRAVFLPAVPQECKAAPGKKTKQKGGGAEFRAAYLATDNSIIGPTTDVQRWSLLATLAEVLASMHAAGLVHGDLADSNVLCKRTDGDDYPLTAYLRNCTDGYIVDEEHPAVPVTRRRPAAIKDPDSDEAHEVRAATDVYLLARWILRLFAGAQTPGGSSADPRAELTACADTLGPQLAELVEAALGPVGTRPDALAFVVPLAERFDAAVEAGTESVD